jgi:hypothetical protein
MAVLRLNLEIDTITTIIPSLTSPLPPCVVRARSEFQPPTVQVLDASVSTTRTLKFRPWAEPNQLWSRLLVSQLVPESEQPWIREEVGILTSEVSQ